MSRTAVVAIACLLLMASLGSARAGNGALYGATHECRIQGLRNSVQCGAVERALDPARPEGPRILVQYVVIPALARRKLADPVFLLAGGPGQSAIDVAADVLPLFGRLNNRRDLVFVDQRGTGRSAPLICADARHEPLAAQADPELQIGRLMECKAALARLAYVQGASLDSASLHGEDGLRFFTTTLAMQDLDAVRQQLGAARIDLVGVSYGTRAALEYMRQFPGAVRRSVLDAVAPPDMALPASYSTDGQAAFDALLAACEGSVACAARYPRLRRDWAMLLASLPKPVSAAHPLTGVIERFSLTREMLLSSVRQPLYVPSLAAALPAAIDAATHGRYEPLLGLAAMLASGREPPLAMGMHFSVVCAEDMAMTAHSRDAPGADFGRSDAEFYARVCARWPRGSVPDAFYRVPPSRTPTLLLSGGIDPATPPRHAARVAAALGPAARQVVVPNAGHGLLGIGCMRDVVFRFIDAESDREAGDVDARCIETIPRPPAYLPILPTAEPAK